MKNKIFFFALMAITALTISSCAGSRGYGSHRKGYGCPNSSFNNKPAVTDSNV